MALPKPELGLVVHYGFVWVGAGRRASPDSGKERPCLIVRLTPLATGLSDIGGVVRATYLPISHVAPRADEQAMPIIPRVAAHLGLTFEGSWLYISYAVQDDWPFDLAHVPGSEQRFDYGFIPPAFFNAVSRAFQFRILTHPRFVHRP